MKLRNKKTGEIIEDECLAYIIQKLHDRGDVICRGPLLSMDLFAEYWEEVREHEPLIRSKGFRELIRNCFSLSDSDVVTVLHYEGYSTFYFDGGLDVNVSWSTAIVTHIKEGKHTLTELCGK